jgi:hypothetical protein
LGERFALHRKGKRQHGHSPPQVGDARAHVARDWVRQRARDTSMWDILAYAFGGLACITFVVVLGAAFDE